ncbi:10434_t:CDS:1, partial [Funneliformis mosseae]
MAKAIQKIYNNPNDPLNPLEDFIIDKDTEYMDEYKDLLFSYNLRIQYINFKRDVIIAKHDHQEFEKH